MQLIQALPKELLIIEIFQIEDDERNGRCL
jgi:hypothetical protein